MWSDVTLSRRFDRRETSLNVGQSSLDAAIEIPIGRHFSGQRLREASDHSLDLCQIPSDFGFEFFEFIPKFRSTHAGCCFQVRS
jgi:hypothetical protein